MLPLRLLPRTAWTVYLHLDRYCNRGHSCDRDHYRDCDQKEEMPQLQDQMQKERQMLPQLRSATEMKRLKKESGELLWHFVEIVERG